MRKDYFGRMALRLDRSNKRDIFIWNKRDISWMRRLNRIQKDLLRKRERFLWEMERQEPKLVFKSSDMSEDEKIQLSNFWKSEMMNNRPPIISSSTPFSYERIGSLHSHRQVGKSYYQEFLLRGFVERGDKVVVASLKDGETIYETAEEFLNKHKMHSNEMYQVPLQENKTLLQDSEKTNGIRE